MGWIEDIFQEDPTQVYDKLSDCRDAMRAKIHTRIEGEAPGDGQLKTALGVCVEKNILATKPGKGRSCFIGLPDLINSLST